MQTQLLHDLQTEVTQKQLQLQQLSQRIQTAIECTQKMADKPHDDIKCVVEQIKQVKLNQQQLRQSVQKQVTRMQLQMEKCIQKIENKYKKQIKYLADELMKKQKQNEQLRTNTEDKGRIIQQKILQISVLKEKLTNNMNFIIDNCQLQVTDLQFNQFNTQHNQQPNQQSQSVSNQNNSIEYPQALFQDQDKKFDQIFINQQQQSKCQPTSYRIQHFNKNYHSNVNTLQLKKMRENRDSSNFYSRQEKDNKSISQNNNENDNFWKNLTGHISSSTNSNRYGNSRGNRQNKKNGAITGKDKQLLMDKITDFRKILFLDKGISRFGFK